MRICVTSFSNTLESPIDPRFGRCRYFVVVDSEKMSFEAIENPGMNEAGGAGIKAAQTILNQNVDVVLTGNIGPKAFGVLATAGVKTVTGISGTVRDVVEKYKTGQLSEAYKATYRGHFRWSEPGGRRQAW